MAGNFFCQECGYESRGWLGKCPACGAWNSFVEAPEEKPKKAQKQKATGTAWLEPSDQETIALSEVTAEETERLATGLSELDLVLGGGLVPGSLILLGGEPGVGKSTLLLQIVDALNRARKDAVLYVSGEESPGQIKLRAERLGIPTAAVRLLASTNFSDLERAIDEHQPHFVFIDSIQTLFLEDLASAPGSPAQLRAVTAALLRLAKAKNICMILVGHVTKDGQIAGPRILEHMVDTVLYFEGESESFYRLLRAHKNRFGSAEELGVFELDSKGLHPLENPSKQLLSGRPVDVPGTALTVSLEGSRPLLVELQALCSPANFSQPLRMAEGYDRNRLSLLLALLAHHGYSGLASSDVYLNITGGFRLRERAADLAVVAAVISSLEGKAIDQQTVIIAELGLAGELRRVQQIERRITEAVKLGFSRFILPAQSEAAIKKLDMPNHVDFYYASLLAEAIDRIFP